MISRSWLFIVMGCLCAVASAEVRYTVTELGPGFPSDLNNKGVAVLYLVQGNGIQIGPTYLWDGAHLAYLPLSSLPPGYITSVVYAENDKGQLAGWVDDGRSWPDAWKQEARTAFWKDGPGQPPILIGKTAEIGRPSRMNAAGHILLDYRPDHVPAVWSAETGVIILPILGAGAQANAINDSDLVVGVSWTAERQYSAVRWKDGQIHPLDSGSWLNGNAHAVAADGTVVGSVWDQDEAHGQLALWSPAGTLQTFAFPGGWGSGDAINSAHQVVGQSGGGTYLFGNGTFSFLKDLVPAGTPIEYYDGGLDINDKGQILIMRGIPIDPSRSYGDSVLLTPIPPMARALAIAGGLQAGTNDDVAALGVTGSGSIGLVDAVHLARQAAGLER